jgi:hypothetical protein
LHNLPATVVSSLLESPLDWPEATLERGDEVEIVTRLKKESDMQIRGICGLRQACRHKRELGQGIFYEQTHVFSERADYMRLIRRRSR